MPTATPPPTSTKSQQPTSQPTLTLPAAHFAALAPASYLATTLSQDPPTRPSSRSPTTFRGPSVTTSSLTHAAGSAVVRTGGTAVVVGITAETLLAADVASTASSAAAAATDDATRLAQLGLLVPHVDLATGCAPRHAPGGGGPPSALAQSLAVTLDRILRASSLVELGDLLIRRGTDAEDEPMRDADDEPEFADPNEVVAYWTLYINAVVLSLDGETALPDALWGATYAALRDVRLPETRWDGERGRVVCSPAAGQARRLRLQGRPVCATWGVFQVPRGAVGAVPHGEEARKGAAEGRVYTLADPDAVEDGVCHESVRVVLDCSSGEAHLVSLSKSGGYALGIEEVARLIGDAEGRWREWDKVLP